MPTIIALIFASILIFFPSDAIAAGGTSQYKPSLSYDNAELNGQDFSGKNLQTAVFTTAKLDKTNFSGADLHLVRAADILKPGAKPSPSELRTYMKDMGARRELELAADALLRKLRLRK